MSSFSNGTRGISTPPHGVNPAGNGKDRGAELSHLSHLSLTELHEHLNRIDERIREAESHGPAGESFKPELHTWRAEIFRELERRWAPTQPGLGVNTAQIEFPEAAWTGLFATWREVVAPCTEASLEKLWSALLVAAGLAIGRNAYVVNPFELFPNFYLLLVGQTANARKTTVLRLVEQLLERVDADVEILRGFVSTEGIFEVLARNNRALGYADEFRYLLSVAKRRGTSDILAKMNSLYSCPRSGRITRKDKCTTIENPFFSFVSATPLEYCENLLSNDEITGGVLNRYLVVSGKEQPAKPRVRLPTEAAWRRVVEPLWEIAKRFSNQPRCFEFDEDGGRLWDEFYIALHNSRETAPAREAQLTARIDEHVLKIALIYSVLSHETKITSKSLAIGIAIGRWLQASALNIFSSVGLDAISKLERDIVEELEKRGWIHRRDLQRQLSHRESGELFARALKSLEANGFVQCHDGKTRTPYGAFFGGQPRPWIEYTRGDS